jgi:hypothetical protein
MIDVSVKFEVDGLVVTPEDLQDEQYELAETLEYTAEHLRQHVHHQLDAMRCPEHGGQPRVMVTGIYTGDTEQMELSYHVDTCCQQLLMRAVQALNH